GSVLQERAKDLCGAPGWASQRLGGAILLFGTLFSLGVGRPFRSLCVVRLDCLGDVQSAALSDRGYSLCPRPIRLKFSQVFFRPAAKRFQRLNQSPTQSCQRVFY